MRRITRAAVPLIALAFVAGCEFDEEGFSGFETLREVSRQVVLRSGTPEPLSEAQVRQALATVPQPLKFIEVTSRQGQGIITPIQENGPYTTYASSLGQHVVFRNGLAVQSRGFGGDLMSSDEDALLALLRARQTGSADYTMRYLSGDNDTITYRYTCNVLPQGPTEYAAGVVRAQATALEVHCVSETGPDFVSDYTVDGSGEILEARQWFGGLTDFLVYRTLRRE